MNSTGRITLALSLVFIGAVLCAGCISTNTSAPDEAWVLESNKDISLVFSEDGTFRGHGPVNSFGGEYSVHENRLVLEHTYVTEMAGPAADMRAEDAFFTAFSKVARYACDEGRLVLLDAEGTELLVFR